MRDSRLRRFITHGSAGVHPDEMFTVMSAGIDRDWRIETHSIGDRAVRTLLDVYERLVASNTGIPAGHPSH